MRKVEPKPAPGKHKIGRTVMWDPKMLQEIDDLAGREGRSFSGMVVRLVDAQINPPSRRRAAAE